MDRLPTNQIVSLKQDDFCLYSEVIQIIPVRKYYWVRPILLVFLDLSSEYLPSNSNTKRAIALDQSSDLLLPWSLFTPAFDTELIPLLSLLQDLEPLETKNQIRQLNSCLQKIWQANRNLFESIEID